MVLACGDVLHGADVGGILRCPWFVELKLDFERRDLELEIAAALVKMATTGLDPAGSRQVGRILRGAAFRGEKLIVAARSR